MAKDIITETFTWEFQQGQGTAKLDDSQGKSLYTKIAGDAVLKSSAKFSIDGYTGGSIDIIGSGATVSPVQVNTSALTTKVENGELVLLDGDSVSVSINGQKTNPVPPPATVPTVTTDVLILRASQHEVKGT